MNTIFSFNEELLQNLINEAVKNAVNDTMKSKEPEKSIDTAKKYVSREELAKQLDVSIGWIYLQMRDNNLPYYKKGRRVFFDLDEVHNFMLGGRNDNK